MAQVLRALAASRPVVVAIDDVQWLDRPSARVLSFVFRRLTDEPIGVLESLRLGSGAPGDPIETDRALADAVHLAVGPLTVGALGRILRERTKHEPSRDRSSCGSTRSRTAIRCSRSRSPGPPAADASASPGEPWPVPEDVQRVLSGRLAQVPPAAHRPLLAIAATSQPTWELVAAGRRLGRSARSRAWREPRKPSIIERVDGRVRFTHPLLASTVYLHATERDRRLIHTRLASLLDDPEEHARHLALGTEAPNADVAAALDQAAQHARRRGAPDAAAELARASRAR